MLMNEKIRASELLLTGLDGEPLGVVSREEALAMAKKAKVDLVCESLMSSPPPCKLVAKGQAKRQTPLAQKAERTAPKTKEIRLTAQIEQHDYETKQRQIEKLLQSGQAAQLVVRLKGRRGEGDQAKELLQRLVSNLQGAGTAQTGIQVSGKQAAVVIEPNH